MYENICKHCNETISVESSRNFSNHVRWCKKNPSRNNTKNISISKKKRDDEELGKLKSFKVDCKKCGKMFHVVEREKHFPKKEKYFCNVSCANSRIQTKDINDKKREKNRIASLKLWQNEDYIKKVMSNKKSIFTSKNEVLIREHFIKKFPNDEWTFGGSLKVLGQRIVRDLYSKKLKICFEYDGVWHFKDIHNQLRKKQIKDKLLERWCKKNNYKLVRIDELKFKDKNLKELEKIIYNDKRQIIKIGDRYL